MNIDNLKILSNQDLLFKIKTLASEDRKLQVLFLKHLKEVEKRKLFLEIGFSSLFEYVVQDLGYSESTAYRRIEAARLLNDLPEIEEKLKSGALSLNTAAQVQTHFKKIKKYKTQVLNSNLNLKIEKTDLVAQLENKSSREVERHLLSLVPEPLLPKEKIKPITSEHTELKLILTSDQKQRLDQLKLLLSHVNPNMTYQELIDHLCQRTLKQLDPSQKNTRLIKKNSENLEYKNKDLESTRLKRNESQNTIHETVELRETALSLKNESNKRDKSNVLQIESQITKTQKTSRYIPSALKVKIYNRDQGCCSYMNPQTKKRCGSKFQLQLDHIKPFALGGGHEEENLRLLCSAHNQQRAENTFGIRKRP